MEKVLTPLPGVLPPKLQVGRASSPAQGNDSKQGEEGGEERALLAQILQLDTTGLLSSVSFSKATQGGTLPPLEDCATEFRQVLCDHIARLWPKQKAKAQEASDLLDRGNRLLVAHERSGGVATSSAPAPAVAEQEQDAFWDLPPSEWQHLLVLQAERGPGPATLHAETGGRRRVDSGSSGGRAARPRQHEWQGVARTKLKMGGTQLSKTVQLQLAQFLESVIEASKVDPQMEVELDTSESPTSQVIIQRAVVRLQRCEVGAALLTLPLDFSLVCQGLKKGDRGLASLAALVQVVAQACQEAGVEAGFGQPQLKDAVLEQADTLSGHLATTLKELVSTFQKQGSMAAKVEEDEGPAVLLPESIQANREAYAQGEWRKHPYAARPYKRLQKYHFAEDRKVLQWKMQTRKQMQCDGQHCLSQAALGHYSLEKEAFETGCACLAKNTECTQRCGCRDKGCVNTAIQRRDALKLGVDVVEGDTWGMDCYTRRNIQDAVLESQVFGPYTRPDYKALIKKKNAGVMTQGETLQRNVTGSEAGISIPQPANSSEGGDASPKQVAAEAMAARVGEWHETVLMPAINSQGNEAWNLGIALEKIMREQPDTLNAKAAAAVAERLAQVGDNYFRVHPKGVGIVCHRPGGLPALTFIEEYLGEVHTPARWFEIQDALKKNNADELPDFYNIQLERPRDDPGGYDCLFIDAAAKGAFCSRMSHSCTPNCQAVVMTAGERLTIAVFTLRQIKEGEELTFDYSSVTESEKEFKAAVCLCGTTACRGSFLYFAGSKAFMQVLATHHGMFARQILILRAGAEPFTEEDEARLERFGVRECALSWGPGQGRVPLWLQKWVSLSLEYVELEQRLLPAELLAIPPPLGNFTPETAASQAKGVSDNRLQNVVITLDKVKLCLGKPGQPQEAPLTMMGDKEIMHFLWTGERSVAKRVLRAAAPGMSNPAIGRLFAEADTLEELREAVQRANAFDALQDLAELIMANVRSAESARAHLLQLGKRLRAMDKEAGCNHCAIADLLFLYAHTVNWFQAIRDYKGFVSPPVNLNLANLHLDRTSQPKKEAKVPPPGLSALGEAHINGYGTASGPESSAGGKRPASDATSGGQHSKRFKMEDGGMDSQSGASGAMAADHADYEEEVESEEESEEEAAAKKPTTKQRRGGLSKKYGPWFIWGQLNAWYKQTVYDPTASLSAERRGTISLPDVECAIAAARSRYSIKEKEYMIDQLEKRPDAAWRSNSMWTFRNDAKVYGSPTFDAAWSKLHNTHNPLPEVLAFLKTGTSRNTAS